MTDRATNRSARSKSRQAPSISIQRGVLRYATKEWGRQRYVTRGRERARHDESNSLVNDLSLDPEEIQNERPEDHRSR